MRLVIFAAFALLTASTAGTYAAAKTATASIGESAQIVPGNTASAYIVGGQAILDVRDDALPPVNPYGVRPLVRVGFELNQHWFLVKRVTWDKAHHQLTIDF